MHSAVPGGHLISFQPSSPPPSPPSGCSVGSDDKVGEVDIVVGKDGGPSEAVDVEGRRDGILSLVVGSIVDVKLAPAVD